METSAYIVPFLFFGFIFFIIGVLITRWIFKVDTIVEYQKKQYLMLKQLANKMGVGADSLLEIDNPALYSRKQRERAKAAKKNAN